MNRKSKGFIALLRAVSMTTILFICVYAQYAILVGVKHNVIVVALVAMTAVVAYAIKRQAVNTRRAGGR